MLRVRAMSLCIASHAYNQRHHKRQIILCSDALAGDEYSTSETTLKFDIRLGTEVAILFAGTVDYAEDAISTYRDRLSKVSLTLSGYKEELYVGFQEFSDSLIRRGVERPDVQLLIAGFIEGEPRITYVDSHGVQLIPSVAAIGSGAYMADAILRWRKPDQYLSTHAALYFVYEAKRLGEASPSVGKVRTHIQILEELNGGGFRVSTLLPKALSYLSNQFEKFGPQEFKGENDAFPWEALFTHRGC